MHARARCALPEGRVAARGVAALQGALLHGQVDVAVGDEPGRDQVAVAPGTGAQCAVGDVQAGHAVEDGVAEGASRVLLVRVVLTTLRSRSAFIVRNRTSLPRG